MSAAGWFQVDRAGLAEIAKRRGVHFIITEPIQNAWDEKITRVDVRLEPVPGRSKVDLTVEDDSPDGFRDLADSYMMFRSSYKLANPEQRGRFNVGEKFLLAIAESARITSTKGSVIFSEKGRTAGRKKTDVGSVLTARLKMTRAEYERALVLARTLIPPPGILTTINGEELPRRKPVATASRSLDTETRGEEGGFRYTFRKTEVRLYEVLPGEKPSLYEMGIPVDEIDCPWHVDVQQKVPLALDRGAVRYGYSARIETAVAEIMAARMNEEQSREGWVSSALGDMDDDEAVRSVVKKRFGPAVTFDPNSPESNKLALDAGYHVVKGGELSRKAWQNVKRAEALAPSSHTFPDGKVKTSPDGEPSIPRNEWDPKMLRVAEYAEKFARHISEKPRTEVLFFDHPDLGFAAFAGPGTIAFNVGDPEVRKVVDDLDGEALDRILIHETAHFKVEDHLTHAYHRECCRIGARIRASCYESL